MESGIEVVLFDVDGRVRSASSGAGARLGAPGLDVGTSLDDALAADPPLREWVAAAAGRAKESGAYDSCVLPGSEPVEVAVAPIAGGDGFALVAALCEPAPVDGSAVSQQAWHDIKNQLGGLKLYATFLKMKLGKEDDLVRETSEKIVRGIDAIVQTIAEVRRGDEKTKGEEA
jgi:hypothetical protein